ncbi:MULTISPECIES: TlpA disulfide reductase family protein [Flavobacteriaceae]|uniref:TlpA disulfide reductase family protein n=1 Tax=Flavobacteriaceae TaxID=49546 RepID=UPI001490F869|nr:MULTISPECIES: TlpA disulfide reductase family protein [Allomuricauda]MDC6367784.1 TlpA disulfide reductase family protein [Muricauda sp. AC10]
MKNQLLKTLWIGVIIITLGSCKHEIKKEDAITKKPSNSFTIKGTVKNMTNGQLSLNYQKENGWGNDSITVLDGKFTFKGAVGYPSVALIGIKGTDGYPEPFFLENNQITMNIDTSAQNPITIKGSPLHDEYVNFKNITAKPFDDKLMALYEKLDTAENQDEAKLIELEIDELTNKSIELSAKYINENPDSFVAASAILDEYSYNPVVNELEPLYNNLSDNIKSSVTGAKIKEILEIAKKTSIGSKAMDLTVNDLEGNPITLSELQGKVVFLDFWASWCGPCRAENSTVKKAYAKYKDKGFEIYAVSLDVSKDDWAKAIDEDGLPWIHVSDLKNDNEAAKLYGVSAIPMNYLLDKNGVIIAKALRGEDLLEKLEEVL